MMEPNNRRSIPRPRGRPSGAPLLLVAFESGAAPLHEQVYDALRRAILDGRLRPGMRLPSSRALAAELGVARNTVLEAFARLRAEGYVRGARGGGTRVRDMLPDALLSTTRIRPGTGARRPPPGAGARAANAVNTPTPALVAGRGRGHAAAGAPLVCPAAMPPIPFQLGLPAVDAFPARLWAQLEAQRWRAGRVCLGDGDPAGERALRVAVAEYVTTARGAHCTAEQVVVVSGAQQAFDLCARLLLDDGDAAWVEDPGYTGARAALAAAGARIVPVPVDGEGIDVAEGGRRAPGARLAYVTPSHQFPLGAVMSVPRRLALLAWARRTGAWIIEDDYDSEFRYGGRPLPCLQGLDAAGGPPPHGPPRVLYVGTFNKTLAPGLRLGYLVVPHGLIEPVRAARAAVDRHPPTLAQGVLADFVGEGHYARHLRRVRTLYAERQAALLGAAAALDGRLTFAPDPAGLHLVGWLPASADDAVAADSARQAGIEAAPLSRFYAAPKSESIARRGALLLGYAAFDSSALRAGVDRLRDALAPAQPAPPRSTV